MECSIKARDLAWEWIGDAHERFSVGDQVLVHILNVRRDSLNDVCFAVNRIDEERGEKKALEYILRGLKIQGVKKLSW